MKHTMTPFEEILLKENKDEKYIYFHSIEEGWRAFGRSAYYLVLLYPKLEIIRESGHAGRECYVNISNERLLQIEETCRLFVGDEYIKAAVPSIVYCMRKGYTEWERGL